MHTLFRRTFPRAAATALAALLAYGESASAGTVTAKRRLGNNVDMPANSGVWIGSNTFATVDGQTSTLIVYSVP